jgi:predicted nucleic acid-binding Zn ribbon protein
MLSHCSCSQSIEDSTTESERLRGDRERERESERETRIQLLLTAAAVVVTDRSDASKWNGESNVETVSHSNAGDGTRAVIELRSLRGEQVEWDNRSRGSCWTCTSQGQEFRGILSKIFEGVVK